MSTQAEGTWTKYLFHSVFVFWGHNNRQLIMSCGSFCTGLSQYTLVEANKLVCPSYWYLAFQSLVRNSHCGRKTSRKALVCREWIPVAAGLPRRRFPISEQRKTGRSYAEGTCGVPPAPVLNIHALFFERNFNHTTTRQNARARLPIDERASGTRATREAKRRIKKLYSFFSHSDSCTRKTTKKPCLGANPLRRYVLSMSSDAPEIVFLIRSRMVVSHSSILEILS